MTIISSIMCTVVNAQTIIGGTNGDQSAVLELRSSNQGFLLPRMTSAERSAIVSPAEGLIIYNTTEGCMEINLGSSTNPDWNCLLAITGRVGSVDCDASIYVGTLTAGIPVSGVSVSIPYTEGNGSFHKGQMISSTGVTGLTAVLDAGIFASGSGSVTYKITGTPSASGTAVFALSVGGQNCLLSFSVSSMPEIISCGAYVASGVWKEFMCHNLGADPSADPFTPSWELVGNYYQWGRNPTCFGRDGQDSINPCSSPVFGAAGPWGNTETNDNAGSITGWSTTEAPDGLWADGSKTNNDPCPTGYRVPTITEWSGVISTNANTRVFVGTWTQGPTNYSSGVLLGSSLFLPAAGYRLKSNGELSVQGSNGNYWSSSVSDSFAQHLYFFDGTVSIRNGDRPAACSLRCIAV